MKNNLEERFNKVFDVKIGKVDEALLLDLICINNSYSTRGGDSFIFPKKLKGLKEEVLNTLIVEKSDRVRVRKRIKDLFSM